jgi:hypothetical protein
MIVREHDKWGIMKKPQVELIHLFDCSLSSSGD